MNTQKRNRSERAFTKGYSNGVNGKSKELCPHSNDGDNRVAWMAGWREGRSNNWDGLTGVSGIHLHN